MSLQELVLWAYFKSDGISENYKYPTHRISPSERFHRQHTRRV